MVKTREKILIYYLLFGREETKNTFVVVVILGIHEKHSELNTMDRF